MTGGKKKTPWTRQCIELGAEDYLLKPFNPILLRARIKICLEKKRLRDFEESYLDQLRSQKRRADRLLEVILPTLSLVRLQEVRPWLPTVKF